MFSTFLALLLLLAANPLGVVEIRSQPDVEVLWEGTALAETDADGVLTIRQIPFGDYAVIFRKAGFREVETVIEVRPGAKTVFMLRLEEAGGGAANGTDPVPVEATVAEAPITETTVAETTAMESNETVEPAVRHGKEVPDDEVVLVAPTPVEAVPAAPVTVRPVARRMVEYPWRLLLLAGLSIGAVMALAARQSRKAARLARPPVSAGFEPHAEEPSQPAPAFLEELKRRERLLDPREREEIIDVEVREVRRGPA